MPPTPNKEEKKPNGNPGNPPEGDAQTGELNQGTVSQEALDARKAELDARAAELVAGGKYLDEVAAQLAEREKAVAAREAGSVSPPASDEQPAVQAPTPKRADVPGVSRKLREYVDAVAGPDFAILSFSPKSCYVENGPRGFKIQLPG